MTDPFCLQCGGELDTGWECTTCGWEGVDWYVPREIQAIGQRRFLEEQARELQQRIRTLEEKIQRPTEGRPTREEMIKTLLELKGQV